MPDVNFALFGAGYFWIPINTLWAFCWDKLFGSSVILSSLAFEVCQVWPEQHLIWRFFFSPSQGETLEHTCSTQCLYTVRFLSLADKNRPCSLLCVSTQDCSWSPSRWFLAQTLGLCSHTCMRWRFEEGSLLAWRSTLWYSSLQTHPDLPGLEAASPPLRDS